MSDLKLTPQKHRPAPLDWDCTLWGGGASVPATFKRHAPAHCCPFCMKPVGYLGRAIAALVGRSFHNCDNSNVVAPPQVAMASGELLEGMNYNCPCVHPSQCDDGCMPRIEMTANGWQPIFCAPRNGTEVLVWNGRRRHVASCDKVEEEWVSSFRTTTKRLIVTPPPSHWQHLPDGPEVEHMGVVSVEGPSDE